MAYDEALADRVRDLLSDEPTLRERTMFGGRGFMVRGNMVVAASGQGGILVRVDPAEGPDLIASTPAEPMEMRGRPLNGWLRVPVEHLADDEDLGEWVRRGASYAATLPAK